jgi:hypothetical protein
MEKIQDSNLYSLLVLPRLLTQEWWTDVCLLLTKNAVISKLKGMLWTHRHVLLKWLPRKLTVEINCVQLCGTMLELMGPTKMQLPFISVMAGQQELKGLLSLISLYQPKCLFWNVNRYAKQHVRCHHLEVTKGFRHGSFRNKSWDVCEVDNRLLGREDHTSAEASLNTLWWNYYYCARFCFLFSLS